MPEKRLTRGQAIRAKCLECCCGQSPEVRKCKIEDCPLYPYRMGREIAGSAQNTGNVRRSII